VADTLSLETDVSSTPFAHSEMGLLEKLLSHKCNYSRRIEWDTHPGERIIVFLLVCCILPFVIKE
jgi:hypothetical protein